MRTGRRHMLSFYNVRFASTERPPPRYAVFLQGITHKIYQFCGAR